MAARCASYHNPKGKGNPSRRANGEKFSVAHALVSRSLWGRLVYLYLSCQGGPKMPSHINGVPFVRVAQARVWRV